MDSTITIALWWGLPLAAYLFLLLALFLFCWDFAGNGGMFDLTPMIGCLGFFALTTAFLLYMTAALWWRMQS